MPEVKPAATEMPRLVGQRPGWIGVVTVTYNSADVLPDFFQSLAAQTCPEYTLYLVDNASKDASLEMCRSRTDLPMVVIANDTNVGIAEGNNQGIRAALKDGCEYVLLLNNDTVFDGRLFAELREGLNRHNCAMVTPKILYYDPPATIWAAGGRFQRWAGYRTLHYGDGDRDRGQFDTVRRISYAPTCCVLLHKTVFDQIGLMDPLYFVYSDDTDFMYRAMKAGLVMMYLPSCTLQHKVATLTGGIGSLFANQYGTRNRIYFLRKHLSPLWAAVWTGIYCAHLFLRYLLGRDPATVWNVRRNAIAEGMRMRPCVAPNQPAAGGLPGVQR